MRVYYVIAVNFVSFFAIAAARVLFALHALHLGANPFHVGLLAAANQVFSMLFSIPAGALGDRYGARWLLVFGSVCGGIGLLLPYFWPGLPALYAAAALCGIWGLLTVVLSQSLVGTLSPPERLTRNFTNFALAGSVSAFAAPLYIGYAVDALGHELASLALVPFALAALVLLAAGGRLLPAGHKPSGPRHKLGALLADRELWWILAFSGAVQLCTDLFPFYLPIYGHALGLSASAIGLIVASASLAAFATRLVMEPLIARLGEQRLLALSLGLSALGFVLVPLFGSVGALAVVSFVFGIGLGVGQPLTSLLMFRNSPKGRSGEAMGLRIQANSILRVLAPSAFGGLAALAGLTSVFLATGALIGSAAGLIGWRARRHAPGP